VETEATIKIIAPPGPDEGEFICTAEGNGPVNALDNALRQALEQVYPHLRELKLVNYKVRILDEASGTAAVTRVLIDVSDGERVWGTIGVSGDIIAASWEALVDSLTVGIQQPASRTPSSTSIGSTGEEAGDSSQGDLWSEDPSIE
jgi:2-isopropylmalate synthase